MSKHIAIAIGSGELRALWIRKGAVWWHAQAPLPDPDRLDEAMRALLSTAPAIVQRSRATVALSPRWVRTKRLHGLPAVSTPRVAAQLLRENERAFFLWNGRPSTVVVHFTRDGVPWAAAYDTEFLDRLVSAARSARLRLVGVLPSLGALGAMFADQRIGWRDGDERFEIVGTDHGLLELRRVSEHEAVARPPIPDALRSIDADPGPYLPAYAVSVSGHRLPLGWRPGADPIRLRRRARAAYAAACAGAFSACLAAALAPALRTTRRAREAQRQLRQLAVVQTELSSAQADLRRVTSGLEAVAHLASDRGRLTRTLGALSRTIPESTAILDIRLDSVEGAFTAIAPRVADVLPALTDVREITAPRIVGSVTREVIAGARLERAVFRFRQARPIRTR